jgi:hypothetical protein
MEKPFHHHLSPTPLPDRPYWLGNARLMAQGWGLSSFGYPPYPKGGEG